jgi:demethylmenaquinone methyltransferase/2-methoxy-6-polyprenyl-1,4-benzoquinol methylase
MFDRIAPRYDLLNRLLSAGIDTRWRRAAVSFLSLPGARRILDLCSGTADLLAEALRREAGRWGVGVDLSREMLTRGAAKLRRRGLDGRAALAAGDVETLPFAAQAFDGALVAFGIRNVPDPAAALLEARRVLRPGGRLVVLEFSTPGGLLGAVYGVYFRRVLPWIGGLLSGDRGAYAYLPASVSRFPDAAAFQALMNGAGFADVVSRPLTGGIARLYRGERPR